MQIFQVIEKVIWSELGEMFSHTNFSFFMGISTLCCVEVVPPLASFSRTTKF